MNTQQLEQLEELGFVTVAYPAELREAVAKAVASWVKFCSLPDEYKEGLPYSNSADGIGYERKHGIGPNADRKENFDATISGVEWLRGNAERINRPEAIEFVNDSTALVAAMKPAVLQFARDVEHTFGVEGLADEVDGGEGNFFVRFIHYYGDREVGEETAAAHTDQSGFTFHLFESHSGLQGLTLNNKQWVDMPVTEGNTVIIPSMQLQLKSEGRLTACCHRVIATEETARVGRYSAVCFIQLRNTPKYAKAIHGRLQEKQPGFNYGMDPLEFAKLFK